MNYLKLEYVLKLHNKLITATGGSSHIRDRAALESALLNAQATFGGEDLYPTVEEKCSNICYSIISNHPFIDGNKRIGIYVMLVLLEYNGISIEYTQEEIVELGLGIAKNEIKHGDILEWILQHKIRD